MKQIQKDVMDRGRTFMIVLIAFFFPLLAAHAQWNEGGLKMMEVMDRISRYYVDTIDEEAFVEQVIEEMLHELDPHSSYISEEELKELSEQLNGEFEGIGVSFNVLRDTIYIISTIQGGPSEKVGILPGDRIITVGDETVAGIGISTGGVQKRLKGKKGTTVDVGILRRGQDDLLQFTIIRDKIPVYSLDASYMVDKKTGYIKLSRFSQTTAREFEEALSALEEQGMENLILDLTGNGGGYLRIAIELADHFLSSGREIVYTEGSKVPKRDYKSTRAGMFETGRLVIMIDEQSASASEIVSGAVQEWDRGILVGRRSFGKGLVQQPFRLADGSELRLTIARYYTPTGRLIQKPYENGYKDYAMDLINRYNQGELNSADSIVFPESEKYSTLVSGRTVYGGGGIMPDYFVPIDTTDFSPYYRDLVNRGIFNQYLMSYIDVHRPELEARYPDFSAFNRKFEPSPEMLDGLIGMATDRGLEFVQEDWDVSGDHIKLLMKAYIARDLWESSMFYEIYNTTDPIFMRAKEILSVPRLYDQKLTPAG
jgi:carboxyl-terminal processing protease